MTWLSENWMLVLVIGGLLLFMLRGGGMKGCGMGQHGGRHRSRRDDRATDVPPKESSEDTAGREAVAGVGTSGAGAPEPSPAQTRSDLPAHSHRGHCC